MKYLYETLSPAAAAVAEQALFRAAAQHLVGYRGGSWTEWRPEPGVVLFQPPVSAPAMWNHPDHGEVVLLNNHSLAVVCTLYCISWSANVYLAERWVPLIAWAEKNLDEREMQAIFRAID